jgi:hypothetical protein
MRPALDPAGHRVPQTKPTCLLHTWRPHQQRPFALVLHLHQHESSRNLHLQYLAKNQSTQRCQSLITQGSDHPPVLEPHMVLRGFCCIGCICCSCWAIRCCACRIWHNTSVCVATNASISVVGGDGGRSPLPNVPKPLGVLHVGLTI